MGYLIWHDREQDYAGYLCTTSDTTIPLPQLFHGDNAHEQAEDFLDYIGDDPRRFTYHDMCLYHEAWWGLAFDKDGEYVGAASRGLRA